ncbi:MAG: hypothetical protein M3Y57_06955 [Acidobacteriota bacterium]|nr:hypothetical protein [Acidobacteriota bacterium]
MEIPDLLGVRDRKYLDHTALVRHRGIGDLMRYAALNQGADLLSDYGNGFRQTSAAGGTRPSGRWSTARTGNAGTLLGPATIRPCEVRVLTDTAAQSEPAHRSLQTW